LEDHKEKMKRTVNIFSLCRGRFALDVTQYNNGNESSNDDNNLFPPPQPHCRTYLSLLTQLGSLHLTRKNYSSARTSFLKAIELEGHDHPTSITNARYQLMNMYLFTNRPSSARKLWNALPNDTSAWIRYSAALIEYVSWNVLNEEGSNRQIADEALANAIRGNVYVAYLLGWKDMFDKSMEYVADVVDWGDGVSSSIIEAVEYYGCGVVEEENERGMALWLSTEGSLEWVRSFVLRVLNGDEDEISLGLKDVLMGWEARLADEEEAYEKEGSEKASLKEAEESTDATESVDDEEDEEPDLLMYAGMFRTAMDWLQDAGEFKQSPTDDYIRFVGATESDNAPASATAEDDNKQNTSSDDSDSADDSDDDSDED
jgi:hypothetical protein